MENESEVNDHTPTTHQPESEPQVEIASISESSPSITSSTSTLTDLGPSTSDSISPQQDSNDLRKTLGGVGASLGGWWGKVQKQSVEALNASNLSAQLNNARKDLAALNLLEKAKKEVEKLGEQAKESYAAVQSELEQGPDPNASQARLINVDGLELMLPTQPETSTNGKARAEEPNESSSSAGFDSNSFSTFFSKLSKDGEKLTASLHSTLSQLPNTVQVANLSRNAGGGMFDLGEVQKLAEGYLAKGEIYLQDVGKELREIVQEAVKVIPPTVEEAGQAEQTRATPADAPISFVKTRKALDTKREASISRLRCEESCVLADPSTEDATTSTAYQEFCTALEEAGGIDGEAWKKKIAEQIESDEPGGEGLRSTFENIVPTILSASVFWTRYFFRMHQIDQEEAARRVVLGAAHEAQDGDFSWDMEDDSEPDATDAEPKPDDHTLVLQEDDPRSVTPRLGHDPTPSSPTNVLTAAPVTSGRNSSEGTTESFDVVSSQPSVDGRNNDDKQEQDKKINDEDEDSDWE